MTILFILVPVALVLVAIALVGFGWATRKGQFDDLETPALRALRDDTDSPRDRPATGHSIGRPASKS
ncbi:MAG: cbb3-type cytochrome oxidase assembly protein CcoS [Gemmatimonadales bacterium]|nr:cbb3-type cytochrome oxidase assembly protein CcoS [Gemmatimonadales bacterium]